MGAADFNTSVWVKGTTEEIVKAVNVFRKYGTENYQQYKEKRDCPYLFSSYISYKGELGLGTRIDNMTDEEIEEFITKHNNSIILSASGPYGIFGFLSEVNLFKDIAEAIPFATIFGGISGFNIGGRQIASYELKNGLMTCKYLEAEEDDDWYDEEEDEEDDELENFDEEPEWDYEEVYDPIKKKIL